MKISDEDGCPKSIVVITLFIAFAIVTVATVIIASGWGTKDGIRKTVKRWNSPTIVETIKTEVSNKYCIEGHVYAHPAGEQSSVMIPIYDKTGHAKACGRQD